jgi:dihydroxyacetone kinase
VFLVVRLSLAGHEPAHSGYIGDGLLSAAIFGNIFASPSANVILSCIRACAGQKGMLLIVKVPAFVILIVFCHSRRTTQEIVSTSVLLLRER